MRERWRLRKSAQPHLMDAAQHSQNREPMDKLMDKNRMEPERSGDSRPQAARISRAGPWKHSSGPGLHVNARLPGLTPGPDPRAMNLPLPNLNENSTLGRVFRDRWQKFHLDCSGYWGCVDMAQRIEFSSAPAGAVRCNEWLAARLF
jgi:hypothetical protein